MRLLIIMGILSFFFGAKAYSQSDEPQILPIEGKQAKIISQQANEGKIFLEKYVGKKASYTPGDIDHAILKWKSTPKKNREPEENVIDLMGSFFGNHLIRKLDLEWAYYKDKQGKDLCVIHREISVYSFPYSAIYKAVVENRENALENVEIALSQQISEGLKDKKVQGR